MGPTSKEVSERHHARGSSRPRPSLSPSLQSDSALLCIVTTMPPYLAVELIEHILTFAALDLIAAERDEPVLFPLANQLLRSASLVSREWRSIGQQLLVKHGLIYPSGSGGFVEALQREGLAPTSVRVTVDRPREAELGTDELWAAQLRVGDTLTLLGSRLRLVSIDCVSCQPVWRDDAVWSAEVAGTSHRRCLPSALTPRKVTDPKLTYTRQLFNGILFRHGFRGKPKGLRPSSVTFAQSARVPLRKEKSSDFRLFEIAEAASHVQFSYPHRGTLATVATHYFCMDRTQTSVTFEGPPHGPTPTFAFLEGFIFPSLTHLSIPFFLLPPIPDDIDFPDVWQQGHLPPSVTTLSLTGAGKTHFRGATWSAVVEKTIAMLPALERLSVPSAWACEEVARVCRARGVALLSIGRAGHE